MDSRALIDAIMRQTTVLIAELSTAAGVRAPLAHLADQVFIALAREIEGQGVRQKVVADMFGLALRSYQRKVQRLMQSSTERHHTLWEAVLKYVTEKGTVTRSEVGQRFRHDDDKDVGAVLRDLVSTGLVYRSGDSRTEIFRATSDPDRRALSAQEQRGTAPEFVWLAVFHHGPVTRAEVGSMLPYEAAVVDGALSELCADGRISLDERTGRYAASTLVVPVGAEKGWEAAVFDHFQAMSNAIVAKIRGGTLRSGVADTVGGATLRFDIRAGHPLEARVRGTLKDVRAQLNALWEEVEAENRRRPILPEELEKITFYFGQGAPVTDGDDDLDDDEQ